MERYRLGTSPREWVSVGRDITTPGGEGRIAEVLGHGEWVAKVFHTTFAGVTSERDLREKRERLERKRAKVPVLVKHRPQGWREKNGHVVLAWPTDVLLDGDAVAGYVMPKIDRAAVVELHQVSNPSDRNDPMPSAPQWVRNANFRHLVAIARNLSAAVETTHRAGAVIGDFNERNVLVSATTQVTLVDCDSMQIRAGGRVYPCELGQFGFTAPELAGVRMPVATKESDSFALAIHIYSLLLDGAHPFLSGTWGQEGEPPDAATRIARGHYTGGRTSPFSPQRSGLPLTFLPQFVLDLFERAFDTGRHDPRKRPTPLEWITALTLLTATL